MADPTGGEVLGLKFATLVAGFAGGVVSLSFVRDLRPRYIAGSVAVGALTAGYTTPLAVSYFSLSGPVENAVGFLIGLTAMNIIPGVLKLSEWFQRNPLSMLRGQAPPADAPDKDH